MKILPAIILALSAIGTHAYSATPAEITDQRPARSDRAFVSEEVERVITEVAARIKDPKLRQMFINCSFIGLPFAVMPSSKSSCASTSVTVLPSMAVECVMIE